MKIPLQYQRTEYDCAPTAFLNAISFLFPRKEVPPDVLRYVMMYTLDCYNNKGEACKEGTSQMALSFLAGWLNQYAKATKLPAACEFLGDEQVQISENSRIIAALQQGGAVVLRVHYGCWHYVTLTGVWEANVELFDPYYRKKPFKQSGIELLTDRPYSANRRVPFSYLGVQGKGIYALGVETGRAAVILYNTDTRKTPERMIEYFL
ncbi:MAG: peptidase C39 [Candidatus Limiplasma sp.]|nr:peptidase C39 [Candidatus Limiplasma sp.]